MKTTPSLSHPSGFTLVEMAIVLAIVGLLLAGLLMPLSAQVDQRRMSETQKALDEINQALIGYAVSHAATDGRPYLPCPDTNGDGMEDRAGTACSALEGNVPWATLGVAAVDSWNNRFRYHVTAAFANSATGFTLTSPGDITVYDTCTPSCTTTVAAGVPAVVLSHGRNGLGAANMAGGTNPAPAGANELENTNGNTYFVSRTVTAAGATGGEFDDLVSWVSPNTLFNRMVAAGRLP